MKKVRWNFVHLLLFVYLLFLFFFTNKIDYQIFSYYINPLVLFAIFCYTFKYSENHHGRFTSFENNSKTVLIATLLYIIIYFLSGFIFGFAKTIYSHEIKDFLLNVYVFVIPIIFIEYIRSFIINDSKNNKLFVILFTILFICLEINYPRLFASLLNREDAFKYISAYILPIIFSNVLYTYLTIMGSYKLVLIYRIIIGITYLITPIFPAHDWFVMGVFGILAPGVIYMSIKFELSKKLLRGKKEIKKAKSKGFIPVVIIVSIFVLFMTGFFKVVPIGILSNSMYPFFEKGDVIIYTKKDSEELKKIEKGNIIVYNKEGQYVVHRVVEVYKNGESFFFITKGDANKDNDSSPVSEDDVIGIYNFHIKYIGYPSVWLNRFFKYEKPKVEIK